MRRSTTAERGTIRAERPPRSFWFDPRFAIGIVLVVASVGGVLWLVSAQDRTVQVWAARAALSPGDVITADDLVLRSVTLGDAGRLYLADAADGGDLTGDGLVITRAVAAGELVPASAVGGPDGVSSASVVVVLGGPLPQAVAAGSTVDLWSARLGEDRAFGPPSVLVGSATVVRVIESDGIVVGGTAVEVEVLVPRSRIALVLEAIANADALSLVPTSLPAALPAGG